jgi:iron(III) transport system substrate-binding protein
MKRFSHWSLLLWFIVMLIVSACGAPATPAPTSTSRPTTAPAVPTPSPGKLELTREQLIAAANNEGEVAVWANTFPGGNEVLKPFHDKYPFIKVKLWDASGDEIINRLIEEAKAGRFTADIFFSPEGDLVRSVGLELMQEYDWKTQGWSNQPPGRSYINWGSNGRLPAFNTNVIPIAEGPKSWEDLALPKWRDKSPVASFSAPDNPLLYAYMWRENEGVLNWERAEKFLTDAVKNNKPKVVRGFPMELLATGEYGIFSPDVSGRNVLAFVLMGAPIALVPVGKTPGLTNSVGIVKNAAHPNAAKVFADWFAAEGGLLTKVRYDLVYALDPATARVSPVNQLLAGKYGIEVEPVPTAFFTPENVKRANNFWLALLGVTR